ELADLHFARFDILTRLGDVEGMADTAAELLSLAKRLASPTTEAEANLAAAMFRLWQSDIAIAREHALLALTLGEQTQEPAICCRAHFTLAQIGMCLGDHRFIRFHAERGLSIAQRLGAPHWEALFHLSLSGASFLSGDWPESLRRTVEASDLARRVGYPRDLTNALAERAMILALKGDLAEAESCISEARMAFGSGTTADRAVFGRLDIAETALALELGRVERALEIASGYVCPSTSSLQERATVGVQPRYMPMGLMLLAQAQIAAGDAASALETAGKLTDLGPAGTQYLTALASRAEGLARQGLGETETAVECLARAYEAFSSLEIPFEAAKSLFERATVLATTGRSGPAIMAARQSLSVFERLDAQRYVDHVQRLLRELGVSPPVARRTRTKKGLLSVRELEVARLVADGLTTTQIAERLGLSRYTVSAHLEHMYARLGIGSRVALTRHVIETGLLSSDGENP
ncbi:MAG: LuxR C-terminal-related transcriptional regulator, partial [Dehalococcoidia bacterium]|nr:LuxR C-terminal-related transcriptional regulator [Dehalococcoidia bacterium]